MPDLFLIYIDRLKGGEVQKIDATLSPDFFDIHEADLAFRDPVKVSGKTYAADEELIFYISASTLAQIPCSICNQWVPIPLVIKDYYYTEPLAAIKEGIFDFRTLLRDALLIELPKTAECQGNCPERATLSFFSHGKAEQKNASSHHFPFNDLKLP